jgi:hypothetical protein
LRKLLDGKRLSPIANRLKTLDKRIVRFNGQLYGFVVGRKESILRRFDVTAISRYFPEFEREMPRYLSHL